MCLDEGKPVKYNIRSDNSEGIPKILWVYADSPLESIMFDKMQKENHRYYAQLSGY